MKLSEGINQYVSHKNTADIRFDTGKRHLTQMFRRIGDVELNAVSADQVMTFLDSSVVQANTWRSKYFILVGFFEFWAARGEMAYLPFPPSKPRVRQRFVPYIYSRAELKILFRAEFKNQPKMAMNRIVMRTFLFCLYGTGALVGEMMGLLIDDVDLRKSIITIRSRHLTRARRIPICNDLCDILRRYFVWRAKWNFRSSHVFVTNQDQPIKHYLVEKSFRRLCQDASIRRDDVPTCQPRLSDLKFTFAVHRITAWIRSGADLNRMLPALAAYMGQRLGSTDRYYQLTPERFKKHLKRLSSQGHHVHWRNDRKLMEFLASL